jgi:hypothetical protein
VSAEAYPLQWPEGWPRTPEHKRESDQRFDSRIYGLTVARAFQQLTTELERLGATNIVISSNIPVRRDGIPYSERAKSPDPGVAAYFVLKKRPMVMPVDRFVSVAGNMRSLSLAIQAMRQLERHGGGTMMERAFTGFAAIAPPDWKRPWREVFGVKPDWHGDIRALFKEKAKHRHPDAGGNDDLMAELNVAFAEAKRELNLE